MFTYIASSFIGWERVCEEEIRAKLKPVSTRILPQKGRLYFVRFFQNLTNAKPHNMFLLASMTVIFATDILPLKVDVLKSCQRICSFTAELTDLPHDATALKRLEQFGQSTDFSKSLQSFYFKNPTIRPGDHQFRVTAERRGLKHVGWKSPEAAAALGSGIVEKFSWPVALKTYNTEIFLEIDDTLAVVGIVLFSDMNRRHRENHAWKTAMNTAFAYCLARAARIQPGHVVVDPLCGVATIPIEAALEWYSVIISLLCHQFFKVFYLLSPLVPLPQAFGNVFMRRQRRSIN
jgi:hypothetical protein